MSEFEAAFDSLDPDRLQDLARDKGFIAERALRPHLWRLIRAADDAPVVHPATHDTGFTYYDAVNFLIQEPEERYG
jgi:hypothetical protein